MANPVTLTIFRHGLTVENENSQYLGWTDAPLSERGRGKTREIGEQLAGWKPDQIISSDLLRCRETVALLFPHQEFCTMPAFREMNFGNFEGKTYEDLKNQRDYQLWLDDIFNVILPGGESFKVFFERINQGMNELSSTLLINQRDIVLVTHGGVIRLLLSKYVDSDKTFFDWEIPNSQGYQLTWDSMTAFRRLEKCTSLSVVPLMAKENG